MCPVLFDQLFRLTSSVSQEGVNYFDYVSLNHDERNPYEATDEQSEEKEKVSLNHHQTSRILSSSTPRMINRPLETNRGYVKGRRLICHTILGQMGVEIDTIGSILNGICTACAVIHLGM